MVTIPATERRTRWTPSSPSVGPFAVNFPIAAPGDVAVYLDGLVVDPSTYTVTLATQIDGLYSSATITADAPGWTGTLDIVGARSPSRTSQFIEGYGVPAADLNLDLNRDAIERREAYDRLNRALVLAPGSANSPLPAPEAGRALIWNADGDGIENGPTASEIADAETNAERAETAAAALTGTSTTTLTVSAGAKTLTTQTGKQWAVGQRIRVVNADATKALDGTVTSYSGTSLGFTADAVVGSGSGSSWTIMVGGSPGVGTTGTSVPAYGSATDAAAVAAAAPGYLRLLSYWSGVPATASMWNVVGSAPAHNAKFSITGGTYAELAELMPDLTMFGCKGDGSYDNYQKITDALGFCAAKGIGAIRVPSGDFHFGTTLVPVDGVGLIGFGPAIQGLGTQRSILRYTGTTGRAIDAKAADDAHRIAFGFRDLAVLGVPGYESAHDVEAIRLGHNHRSIRMFDNVEVGYFGGHGLNFDADNYLIGIYDLNIHDCARHLANSAAIYKNPAAQDCNAIAIRGLNAEANGTDGGTAATMNWTTDSPYRAKGLSIRDALSSEGNLGTDDFYISRCEQLTIDHIYFEMSPLDTGNYRCAIELAGCYGASIRAAGLRSASGNTAPAIRISGGRVSVYDSRYDDRFAADIRGVDSAVIRYTNDAVFDSDNNISSANTRTATDGTASFSTIG